jgi:opine dehydrogenase
MNKVIQVHKVAIIGAGAIGNAMAAYLTRRGHSVGIWSRSLASSPRLHAGMVRLQTSGIFSDAFEIEALDSLSRIREFDVVVVALPATAYSDVLPALARHLTSRHNVIVSGSLSLAPLWLHDMARTSGVQPVITAWGTTLLAASFQPDGTLHIPFTRKRFDIASLPAAYTPQSLVLCRDLFGIEFDAARSVLDINLSNINPIAHAGQLLINFSRIDKSETWKLFENFTESGIRLAEALDAERLALASAVGSKPRSLRRHYAQSYPVEDTGLSAMVRQISEDGSKTLGPRALNHRYLIEDMPYGLAFMERLASAADMQLPMTSAVISILEVMTNTSIRKNNRIADAVIGTLEGKEALLERCMGHPHDA